jgi:hypothetical protein
MTAGDFCLRCEFSEAPSVFCCGVRDLSAFSTLAGAFSSVGLDQDLLGIMACTFMVSVASPSPWMDARPLPGNEGDGRRVSEEKDDDAEESENHLPSLTSSGAAFLKILPFLFLALHASSHLGRGGSFPGSHQPLGAQCAAFRRTEPCWPYT